MNFNKELELLRNDYQQRKFKLLDKMDELIAEQKKEENDLLNKFIKMAENQHANNAKDSVIEFNKKHPIGSYVCFWKTVKKEERDISRTRSEAFLLGGHTPCVLVEGVPGIIALSHVEVIGETFIISGHPETNPPEL